jgi:hypothetical protein
MVPGLAVRITARSCLLDRSPCILAVCSAPATSFGSSRSLSLVVCLFLPLIHSYSLLLTALVIAGFTSGTFYPLTLTYFFSGGLSKPQDARTM